MITSKLGMPLAEGLDYSDDLPHTITAAITIRGRIDGLKELPEDKRPPRDLWWKPYKLQKFLDDVFDVKKKGTTEYIDLDLGEVE